ncbi:MAG: sigma-54-dependent Fis family transcriptional regulator [Candidatus Latescibacteria bacterium]|jgi:DNA-binding NtrC family response regulator|nr:sigma-54-dependent Fis family transcriptional regulator [Candidatus Latescibacterota bacterium]MBT5829654.1 sigma-54-dependent Fis family transcriptional regulator [Candidatus Latescibacterota bacterium]
MTDLNLKGAHILVVDDKPDNIDVLCRALEAADYSVLIATSGRQALTIAQRAKPDIVLLDIMMPDMDGFETCQRLKENEETRDIPVIFVTASDDTADIIRGFGLGGVDYLTKPAHKDEVLVRVKTHLEHQRLNQMLTEKNTELESRTDDLRKANRELKAEITQRQALSNRLAALSERESERWGIDGVVGQSRLLRNILEDIQMLQHADSTSVLITGESGTGKELIARAFHAQSSRANQPFIPVNCATIPRDLAESLLFGHLKGAFTGAEKDQTGYFDLADEGTLFLDEIGDMPYDLQTKLLRVLEDGHVMPLGAPKTHAVNVRILAATNADLASEIHTGGFRQDLFYRIARFTVQVPPLRDRTEDVPLLAQHFLQMFAQEMGVDAPVLSDGALAELADYAYPGNIRELKNIIERALIESRGRDIEPHHLRLSATPGQADTPALEFLMPEGLPLKYLEAELAIVKRAVAHAGGNVSGAARLLEIDRAKVYRILKREEKQNA